MGLLKSFGDAAAIKHGAITYGEAKADYDEVITGLVVALARKAQPASLPDLQAQLQRGFEKRTAFCQSVKPIALERTGEKNVIDQIAKGLAKPSIDALAAIWQRVRDDDALMRQAIKANSRQRYGRPSTQWRNGSSASPGVEAQTRAPMTAKSTS